MSDQRDAAEAVARKIKALLAEWDNVGPRNSARGISNRLSCLVANNRDVVLAALASPVASEQERVGAMTPEEHRLEHLKQMAAYTGPIVSFEFREPYYLASCDACGWVGSSELCGTDSWGDDSDVYCPRCHASGADCGKVADRTPAPSHQEKLQTDAARYHWLRDHSCPPHNFYIGVPDEFSGVRYGPSEVDAYIDEARSRQIGAKV